MKIYTSVQMREREQAAVDAGSSFEQLMENAGTAAASDILQHFPVPGRCLVVCGKGNNGGDGLVIARCLHAQGWQVDIVFLLGEQLTELAELNRQRLPQSNKLHIITMQQVSRQQPYELLIDGVFGTGFSGQLSDAVRQCMVQLNAMPGTRIALDMPTGLNCDTGQADADTFRADISYAFAAYKPAHLLAQAKPYCGQIVCLDIGIE
ncbi:NAD(P)H-hydrate epimerase [Advenella sp. WQ 585]|uniref:NAD(P)H-hydrate epimerase n=1 Tax=Advenella mandrilli TaxID=2800330 RepID=A0ABS1EEX1_9BURK|nr:NAD(P)H-hydrate epimerase [Advenella mandrilli]MBK1780175.1 NAD(P)H-hydrate epimerase [Advenella mandrilli]